MSKLLMTIKKALTSNTRPRRNMFFLLSDPLSLGFKEKLDAR